MNDTPAQIKKATEEDIQVFKTIEKVEKKYRLTPKYMEWERLYLDKGNKETYLNATQSAIQAYNLTTGQYEVARTIGSDNIAKHHNLMGKYYQSIGRTEKDIWDIYWNMMLARKDVNMLHAIGKTMDVKLPKYEPLDKPQYVISQTNNQVNVAGDMSLTFIKEEEENIIEGDQ